MIPTIDLGSIAAIGAILTFLGKIWGYFVKARNFLIQNMVLLVLGSRAWATFFFVGILIGLFSLLNTAFSVVAGKISSLVWAHVTESYDFGFERAVLGQAFPFSDMVGCITYGWLEVGTYMAFVANYQFVRLAFDKFIGVVSSWKT